MFVMKTDPVSPTRSLHHSALAGRIVLDDRGTPVGRITGVVPETGSPDPAWLVVDRGWARARRYVPVEGSYPTSTGDLVVPYDRSWVSSAPKARSADRPLNAQTRLQLEHHYDDAYDWWPASRSAVIGAAG